MMDTGRVSGFRAVALAGSILANGQISGAQGPSVARSAQPTLNIVETVGCAEQRDGRTTPTWWLTRATEPRVVSAGIVNASEVDQVKKQALGAAVFRLIGEADFLDVEGLLQSGQRRMFTTRENANASDQLRQGSKVLVKGVLINIGQDRRINLVSVIHLSDTCPQ